MAAALGASIPAHSGCRGVEHRACSGGASRSTGAPRASATAASVALGAGCGDLVAGDDGDAADRRFAQEVGELLEAAGDAVDDHRRVGRRADLGARPGAFEQIHPQRQEDRRRRRLGGVDEGAPQHRAQLAEASGPRGPT